MIRMNRAILVGIALLLLENAVVPWLVPAAWSGRLVPHLTFVLTVFVACYGDRHRAFLFGLGFGLVSDLLYYGHLIGPYGFGMALIGYTAGLALETSLRSLTVVMGATAFGSLALSTIVYFIYRLFRLTPWSYGYAFYRYMAPSLLLEVVVALALYVPVRRFLLRNSGSSAEDSVV